MPPLSDDPLAVARQQMVVEQLKRRNIRDWRVLAAMARVPRERFVPEDEKDEAYSDRALAIDCGQTISQPYIVALMTEALELTGHEKVLEIGTGSGYQTAILCELAREVISIERHLDLSMRADRALRSLGYRNYQLIVNDGTHGWPALAPYDRIICTAAAARIPSALFEQLADDGILVIPTGPPDCQMLQAIRKTAGQAVATDLSGCRFVPLVGEEEPRSGDGS